MLHVQALLTQALSTSNEGNAWKVGVAIIPYATQLETKRWSLN